MYNELTTEEKDLIRKLLLIYRYYVETFRSYHDSVQQEIMVDSILDKLGCRLWEKPKQ